MDSTKGLILATVFATSAITFVDQVSGKKPASVRPYLGASFMGIFLTAIGMANERLARNFCLLIMLGVLLKDKGGIFSFAATASTGSKGSKGAKKK